MIKSRTFTPDLGDHPGGKYYAYGMAQPLYNMQLDQIPNIAMKYEEGRQKATTQATKPVGMCTQSVESSTHAKPRFNEIINLKYVGFNYAYATVYRWYVPGDPRTTCTFLPYNRHSCSGGFQNIGSLSSMTWADADECQRRAWWAMQPRFESEVSMLNFIYELKDFRRLIEAVATFSWRKALSKLLQARRTISVMEKQQKALSAAAKTSAAAAKVLSDAWLAFQFAIQPLLCDIKEILNVVADCADAAQAEFAERGKDYQISHYAETLRETRTGTYGTGVNSHIFTGHLFRNVFNATLEYSYEYKLRTGWDKVAHVWGLNLTAGVIWEAIPFSFLVDYFYEVGKAIRNMSLDPNVRPHFYQYCESMSVMAHYGTCIDVGNSRIQVFHAPSINGGKELPLQYTPVAGYNGSYYRRRIVTPNKGAALPRSKAAGNKQCWNMTALVASFVTGK